MPDLGATDPADLDARASAELGLSRQLKRQRRETPRPSRGGSTGFPEYYRVNQLNKRQNGQPVDGRCFHVVHSSLGATDPAVSAEGQPSPQSGRWTRSASSLVIFIIGHPDASLEEMAVHIYNSGGGVEAFLHGGNNIETAERA